MASHVTLSIPELLISILQELAGDKAALARSAQCCKAFLNPSLDILWAHLRSVRPLERLLPILSRKNRDGFIGNTQTTTSVNDWIRFDFYATRVTRITPSESPTEGRQKSEWQKMHEISSFFCEIAALRPEVFSFPRLRYLNLSFGVVLPRDVPTSMLLPPSLCALEISIFPSMQIVKPGYSDRSGLVILRDAARFTPCIQSLHVRGDLTFACLTYITHFKRLRVLELGNVSFPENPDLYYHLFHALSLNDNLVELCLTMIDIQNIPTLSSSGFLNLEVLSIGNTPSVVKGFLSMISGSKLRAVSIPMGGEGYYDGWRPCLEYLAKQFGSSLRSIDLHMGFMDKSDRSILRFIQPIMELNLENITLCLPLEVSDEDVDKMASAWPKMKSFRLCCSCVVENSCPGIEALSSFARLCPDLHTLTFEVNSSEILNISDLRMERAVHPHHLKNLVLVVRKNIDYKELAVILDALFPTLEDVVIKQGVLYESSDRWYQDCSSEGKIIQFIREIQSNRKLNNCAEGTELIMYLAEKYGTAVAAGCL